MFRARLICRCGELIRVNETFLTKLLFIRKVCSSFKDKTAENSGFILYFIRKIESGFWTGFANFFRGFPFIFLEVRGK